MPLNYAHYSELITILSVYMFACAILLMLLVYQYMYLVTNSIFGAWGTDEMMTVAEVSLGFYTVLLSPLQLEVCWQASFHEHIV